MFAGVEPTTIFFCSDWRNTFRMDYRTGLGPGTMWDSGSELIISDTAVTILTTRLMV